MNLNYICPTCGEENSLNVKELEAPSDTSIQTTCLCGEEIMLTIKSDVFTEKEWMQKVLRGEI
ncbi:hypothetical protein [Helicobacter himalayensis]|uniref:hypothetical protein n=1 Tax=Helicobacter himalayensis TaxID=1591088 RepID=UPI000836448C|nr:hypothetical protein [Helicobacter himalayensis]